MRDEPEPEQHHPALGRRRSQPISGQDRDRDQRDAADEPRDCHDSRGRPHRAEPLHCEQVSRVEHRRGQFQRIACQVPAPEPEAPAPETGGADQHRRETPEERPPGTLAEEYPRGERHEDRGQVPQEGRVRNSGPEERPVPHRQVSGEQETRRDAPAPLAPDGSREHGLPAPDERQDRKRCESHPVGGRRAGAGLREPHEQRPARCRDDTHEQSREGQPVDPRPDPPDPRHAGDRPGASFDPLDRHHVGHRS